MIGERREARTKSQAQRAHRNVGIKEGVSKCTHPLFYAQSPDFLKPGLCYFLKFLYL